MRWAAKASASRCAAGTLAAAAFAIGIGDSQARCVGVDLVELPGVLDQRNIAAGAHVGHDVGGDPVDILVDVAIAPEEGREFLFETRRRGVEPLRRHG